MQVGVFYAEHRGGAVYIYWLLKLMVQWFKAWIIDFILKDNVMLIVHNVILYSIQGNIDFCKKIFIFVYIYVDYGIYLLPKCNL